MDDTLIAGVTKETSENQARLIFWFSFTACVFYFNGLFLYCLKTCKAHDGTWEIGVGIQKKKKSTTMVECVGVNAATTLKKDVTNKEGSNFECHYDFTFKKREKKRQLSMIASEGVGI